MTLENLRQPQSKAEEHFRDNLVRMLTFMRTTQLMIELFQESRLIQEEGKYRPLRRLSKETHSKLEWFIGVVKKMAGEDAEFLIEQMGIDEDKIGDVAELADVVLRTKGPTSKEVTLLTSETSRRELFKKSWTQSRIAISPKMVVDEEEFDNWYREEFPS
jgi:hypothetical protein